MNHNGHSSSPSMQLTISLIAVLILSLSVIACSSENEQAAPSTNNALSAEDDAVTAYREKVKKRVSASVVSSFAREWNVPESEVECLLVDLKVTQLEDAATDTAVARVFSQCGVDPAVVK